MDGPALINFPLPMITALLFGVVAVLVWRLELGILRARVLFSALFGLCAIEALLVGLRFGYGIEALIPLQRTLPLFLGPLMYLGFAAMTVGRREFPRVALRHLCAPIIILALFWFTVDDLRHLDWVISGSYLFYMIALFLLWRKGPDALVHARIEVAQSVSSWIIRAICLLLFVLTLDSAIALDFAINQGANVTALISFGTIPLILILLAILITLPPMLTRSSPAMRTTTEFGTKDAETEAKLRNLMDEERLFLDPNLTVQRLAKRLHLPARSVSGAINRTRGLNVSQYVNEFRLAHASEMLINSGDSVAKVAELSGFLARSNFYREFQRVFGQSPAEYRKSVGGTESQNS